ncbi:hypothetical protein [Streptomyces lavendofoliae]|uniref:hypothetical protein n=1 Tax=Streptomyces lavendofoliae TaxID=67314 RepID=UPI003D8F0436
MRRHELWVRAPDGRLWDPIEESHCCFAGHRSLRLLCRDAGGSSANGLVANGEGVMAYVNGDRYPGMPSAAYGPQRYDLNIAEDKTVELNSCHTSHGLSRGRRCAARLLRRGGRQR